MSRRALSAATMAVVRAIDPVLTRLAAQRPGARAYVACSGGADSLALALGAMRARAGLLGAIIVDHGLQADSAHVAARTRDQLVDMGYPPPHVHLIGVEVPQGLIRAEGMEGAARLARYRAFATIGTDDDVVMLAHQRDDQAETVLAGMVRGSGTRSLSGMPPRRGRYVRPLLDLPGQVLRQCCSDNGLRWWEDPHNLERSHARVRIRHDVLPVLESELGAGPDGDVVAAALARTARLARIDADYLDDLAEQAYPRIERGPATPYAHPRLDCRELAATPPALASRVVRRWLVACGAEQPGLVHVEAVGRLVSHWRGQGPIDVPGLRVARREGALVAVAR